MIVDTRALGCAHCGAQLTEWLRPWPLSDDVRDQQTEVPAGTWAHRPSPQRPGFPVAVHLGSTVGLAPHPEIRRSIGCCGISYREGQPNLVCAACGAEAGYRLSDGDHCVHGIFLAEHVVDRQAVALPALVDAAVSVVRARGFDALQARFALPEHVAWEADEPYALAEREAVEIALAEVDGLLELTLGGVVVRPPWPAGEQRRLRVLGATAEGTPDDPIEWWFVPAGITHAEERAERHDWLHWRHGPWMGLAWTHRGRCAGVKVHHADWRAAVAALGPRAVV